MYNVGGFRQAEIAEELGKTQAYVAKRLMKIGDALQENKTDEERANAQWEKFLHKFRTDDDEDILWDMFLYLLPVEEQTDIASWFYSYREFYKFGLSYPIIRPFDKVTDHTEFGNRMNELPYHSRYMYYEIFDGQIEELQTAWHLKETFNEIMKITDYDEGVRSFNQLIELAESLEIPEFEDCTKAYRRWFWGRHVAKIPNKKEGK